VKESEYAVYSDSFTSFRMTKKINCKKIEIKLVIKIKVSDEVTNQQKAVEKKVEKNR
jgi:hypothetical protein